MFEQHEREEIARMELSNLRRQVANQSCVIAELKSKSANERQAQHEATWAMAIEDVGAAMTKRKELHQKQEAHYLSMGDTESAAAASRSARGYERAHEIIRAIPCPPLQTTN